MKTQSEDTSPEIEERLIQAWRNMQDWEKAQQITSLNQAVWQLARIAAKQRYPDATEQDIDMRLAALRLDRETMIRVYDWDPKVMGY